MPPYPPHRFYYLDPERQFRSLYVLQKRGPCYSFSNPPFVEQGLRDFSAIRASLIGACQGVVAHAFDKERLEKSTNNLDSVAHVNENSYFEIAGGTVEGFGYPALEAKCGVSMDSSSENNVLLDIKGRKRIELELRLGLYTQNDIFVFSLLQILGKVSFLEFPDGLTLQNYSCPASSAEFRRSRLHRV